MKVSSVLVFFAFLAVAICQNSTTHSTNATSGITNPTIITTTTELPKPNTTTVAPTTQSPSSTTSKPPATLETVKYSLKSKENPNVTCIMVEMATRLVVTYNGTKNVTQIYVNLDNSSIVDVGKSKCSDHLSTLAIQINGNKNDLLVFEAVNASTSQYVQTVTLNYTFEKDTFPLYPGGNITSNAFNLTMFKSDLKRSYLCASKEVQSLTSDNENFTVVVEFSHVKFDPFRTITGSSYQEAQDCQADDTVSEIVPIAVGIALAALVVIVLIAYFIGRRRSRRLAYQSV